MSSIGLLVSEEKVLKMLTEERTPESMISRAYGSGEFEMRSVEKKRQKHLISNE